MDEKELAERIDMVVFLDRFTKEVLPELTGFQILLLVKIMEGEEVKRLAYKMGLSKTELKKELKAVAVVCRKKGLHKILFHK